jgi:hypothetical protein
MKDITKEIGELVDSLDLTVEAVYNIPLDRLDFCATKWARPGKFIYKDGDQFLINSFVIDETLSITATGAGVAGPGTYELEKPFYLPGTKLAANAEWTKASPNLREKTPFIWLYEVIRVKTFGRGDTREFETEVRIFFLDETNVKDFYTVDHRENVVMPMQNLALQFIEALQKDRTFKTVEDYVIVQFSRFGVETDKGVIENIIDANLSGVELKITLTKYKNNCKC